MKLLPTVSFVIASLGVATAAHAQAAPGEVAPVSSAPTAAPSTLPVPGSWSTDLRIGIPVTFSDTGVVMGLANFQLGIGKRVSDRWYLGGTAEWMLGMNVSGGDVSSSLRAGGEARYIFHEGEASVSVDDGPAYTVPRYDWIGVRGGYQTVSGAPGAFGELAVGFDAKVSDSFQFGMYLAAGLNAEPQGAYGAPAADPSSSPGIARVVDDSSSSSYATSPYVSLGWDLTFG